MEDNNLNPEFTPAEKEPHNPVENLTLDPFGNREEVEQAKEEVVMEAPDFAAPEISQPEQKEVPTQEPQPEYRTTQSIWQEQPQQPAQQPVQSAQPQGTQQPIFTQQENNQVPPQQPQATMAPPANQKSKMVAGLLGILVGAFGVHNFYLGKTKTAVIQLLISLLSCFILSPVSQIWGLVEGIQILTGSINTDGNGMPLGE